MLSFSLSHAGQFGLSQNEQKSYFSTNFVQQKVVFVSQRCSGEPSKKNYKLVFLLNLRGERGPDPRCAKSVATWQPSCQKVFEESGSDRKFLDLSPALSCDRTIWWKSKRNDIDNFTKWTDFLSLFS